MPTNPVPTPTPTPVDILPDEAHPVAAHGVRVGMTGRYDGGAYHLGVGQRWNARAEGQRLRAPGTFTGVRVGRDTHQWPTPYGLTFRQVGPQDVAFVVDGDQVTLPVLVEGPLQLTADSPRVLVSTLEDSPHYGWISDNQMGVVPDQESGDWYYLCSYGPGHGGIATFRGTPDNPYGAGEPVAVADIRGAPPGLLFGGPCHLDASGAWVMACLHQVCVADPNHCYGRTGIAVSANHGHSWRWGGFAAGDPVSESEWRADPAAYRGLLSGGASLLFVANADGDGIDYYYTFQSTLRGLPADAEHFAPVTMCRAPARELVSRLLAGEDATDLWRKWKDGGWDYQPFDGHGDVVIPYGGYGGTQIVYCARLNIVLAIFSGHETWRDLHLSWAPDLTGPWSEPQLLATLDMSDGWLWGGPAVLSPQGTVCDGVDWFDVALTAWDEGSGEIRNVAVRVRVL